MNKFDGTEFFETTEEFNSIKKILSKDKIIYKQNSDEIIKHFQLFPEELNLLSSMQYANLLILKKQYEHFSLL